MTMNFSCYDDKHLLLFYLQTDLQAKATNNNKIQD